MSRPRIAILSLGGTITSRRDKAGAAVPNMSAAQLVEDVPILAELAEIECTTVRIVASKDLTLDDAVTVARIIREKANSGFDGVVVVQGTDTLEEMAFAVDLLCDASIPIAFTAAMRHPELPEPDGAANLGAAVRVAGNSQAVGLGVVVVMHGEIHAARYVRKTHTTARDAFASPGFGPLGHVNEGEFSIERRLIEHRPTSLQGVSALFAAERDATFPPVVLIAAPMDDDLTYVDALPNLGYRGIVVQGLGGGHVPAAVADRISGLGLPVVIASRTGAGEVLRDTYGGVGGDIDLAERGWLSAGYLDGPKARVLLRMVLGYDGNAERFTHIVSEL